MGLVQYGFGQSFAEPFIKIGGNFFKRQPGFEKPAIHIRRQKTQLHGLTANAY